MDGVTTTSGLRKSIFDTSSDSSMDDCNPDDGGKTFVKGVSSILMDDVTRSVYSCSNTSTFRFLYGRCNCSPADQPATKESSDSSMDDCNGQLEQSRWPWAWEVQILMDDCNHSIYLDVPPGGVQIPLWTIVTCRQKKPPLPEIRSDSSMDDCNFALMLPVQVVLIPLWTV